MAAAAVSSLACPLRRSSRLTSRRTHSDDDENELTPRALRALKRQRLALDLVPLRPRQKRRRKENLPLHTKVTPLIENRSLNHKPDPISSDSTPSSPEPLTPLTPLSPSPESSPSLPGHDRPSLSSSPSPDPLPSPPPPELISTTQHPPSDHFSPPPLDPTTDTLIPLDNLHPHFHPDLSVQIPPPPQPPLQPLELQDQFHSFPQPQLYVPPPVFVRDREINIWKLACQERVDCLLRRYGIDYIKALVQSEAHSITQDARSSPSPSSQTKFRLYTPASYTYSSTSWGSTSGARKPFPLDDDDLDAGWPIDDADWVDADVDMEDDDEDDYEDEDDAPDPEADREGDTTIEAVQGLVIADSLAPQVDSTPKPDAMHVDESRKTATSSDPPSLSRPPSTADTAPRPVTPAPHAYMPPPPLTPPTLPPLSSLHVPLLSEPPRAFMGRGTPPDRRRLIEWSGTARFATNGMGPPLYLSPVPQRHPSPDVGIVPMTVDQSMHPPSHSNGEWTSFLFSVLEGDGVGVGVGTNMAHPSHPSGPTWYELGLGSVPSNGLDLSLTHPPARTPTIEPPVEDGNTSSSTLRFALG